MDNDSEDRPVALMQCIKDFAKHKESPEYKKAVEESQQQNKKQRRLSQQIWSAQKDMAKAKVLSQRALNGEFLDMNEMQQQLVQDYDDGKMHEEIYNLKS